MATTIARCEVLVLGHPVAVPTGPAAVSYSARECVLVRLEDGDGRVGWGETYVGAGVAAAAVALADLLIGREAQGARALLDLLTSQDADTGAVSALAIALDDLRGRQLEQSVAELYGGALRSSVRAYASSGGYRDGVDVGESFLDDVRSAVADGFTACKVRIGRHHARTELPLLERLRADTPAEVDLMVDANGAYSVPRALEVGRELGRLGYRWFEEPLIRTRGGMSYPGFELLAGLDIAIAGGEGLRGRSAFDDFLARRAVDIIQPDVALCGGVAETLFVAELAALRGIPCVPHAWGGAVLLAATLQLLAVLPEPSELPGPDSPLLELDRFENRMRTELTPKPLVAVDGYLDIPSGPGLGIDVDEASVRALTITVVR